MENFKTYKIRIVTSFESERKFNDTEIAYISVYNIEDITCEKPILIEDYQNDFDGNHEYIYLNTGYKEHVIIDCINHLYKKLDEEKKENEKEKEKEEISKL